MRSRSCSSVDARPEPAHELLDLVFGDRKGGSDENGVLDNITGAGGVHPEISLQRFADHALCEACARGKPPLRLTALHEFEAEEQPQPANVGHVRMVGKLCEQAFLQMGTHLRCSFDEVLVLHDRQHCIGHRTVAALTTEREEHETLASGGTPGDGAFAPNSRFSPRDFVDGMSNTLGYSEVKAYTPNTGNDAAATDASPSSLDSFTAGTFSANGHTEWVDGKIQETGFTTVFGD